jgi:hypothetical protein
VNTFSPPLFLLSQTLWISKDSTKEKAQDWKEKTLPRLLYWFPFEFFESHSSSSLKRYSNLRFNRPLYSVQRFEFHLVYHLLEPPRRHPYRSIHFVEHIVRTEDLGSDGPHRSDRSGSPV